MDSASRTLLVWTALLLGVCGIWLLAAPGAALDGFAVPRRPGAPLFARVAGGALLGLGAVAGWARKAPVAAQRAAHRAFAALFFVASIGTLLALLGASVNLWGWLVLAVSIPFFATHAGCGLGSPPRSRPGA